MKVVLLNDQGWIVGFALSPASRNLIGPTYLGAAYTRSAIT